MRKILIVAMMSMAFLALSARAQTATYLGTDGVTQGTWVGAYGSDGYYVEAGASKAPTYGTVTPGNYGTWTWENSPTAIRDLQNGSSRIAACWWSATSFTLDVNLTDAANHKLSLYMLDWDQASRSQSVKIANAATGAVLVPAMTLSSFANGLYASFTVSGHVFVTVTNNPGSLNAVISGVFLDPAGPSPAQMTVGTGPQTVTLVAGQGATVANPTSSPAQVTIVQLTGSQGPPATHSVVLTWTASVTPGVFYYVYRGAGSAMPTKINSASPSSAATYTDAGLATGSYSYYVTSSVPGNPAESSPSNTVTVAVP